MADESVSMVIDNVGNDIKKMTITWLCASGAATIVATDTDTAISAEIFGWFCFMCVVNPGSPSPTDNYDVVLEDAAGADLFGGQLDACHETTSQTFFPLLAGSVGATLSAYFGPRLISSAITFDIESNSVNAATGVVEVFFSRNPF